MPRDIDDLADDWAFDSTSTGEEFYSSFLSSRPKPVWSPYIDEIAKDVAVDISIGGLDLTANNFGRELGEYYRQGLERSVGEFTDLPKILDQRVSDSDLGDIVYQLNELSYDIEQADTGLNNVQEAIDAVIEKLLTRHSGQSLDTGLSQDGGTIADITTQLFDNRAVASNLDLILDEFEESIDRGLLSLLDEPQMMTPLWEHQREALSNWQDHGFRGYADMATATGKTVLALAALALRYGELHPKDMDLVGTGVRQELSGKDEVLIVAHNDLILEQWRREFDRHLNIPQERTQRGDDIELTWGRIHFRTPQALVNEDRIQYDLVLLDEAHHYATSSEWGQLLDEFDGDVMALSGSVDDAGSDSAQIQERLRSRIGPEIKRYTITEAEADGIIPSFDWEVRYAPFDGTGEDLEKIQARCERSFKKFHNRLSKGTVMLETDRRLETYQDIRTFSHTTEGKDLKQKDDAFRDLVTRLFSRRTKVWNLSPSLDAVINLVDEHSVNENVVVLTDSNAQVEELEGRLHEVLSDPDSVYTISRSQGREEQHAVIGQFDESGQSGVLLGTGDLLGEGVDMQNASVAINMATGGVNPELVQRIGRVLRKPDETKHAMFYNIVGIPSTSKATVPREDGKDLIEAAAEFCTLGSRFNKLPGFSDASDLDRDLLTALLDEGEAFISSLEEDDSYEWPVNEVEGNHLEELRSIIEEKGGDGEAVLAAWEEYAWEHSKDESDSQAIESTEAVARDAHEAEGHEPPTRDTPDELPTQDKLDETPTQDKLDETPTQDSPDETPTQDPPDETPTQDSPDETPTQDSPETDPPPDAEQVQQADLSESAQGLTDRVLKRVRGLFSRLISPAEDDINSVGTDPHTESTEIGVVTAEGEEELTSKSTNETGSSVSEAAKDATTTPTRRGLSRKVGEEAQDAATDAATTPTGASDDAKRDENTESGATNSNHSGTPRQSQLIAAIQELDDGRGYPLTTTMRSEGQYTPQEYYSEFGSWDDALAAADIDKEQRLIDEIQRVAEIVGHQPTTTEMDKHSIHSAGSYTTHFSSWDAALQAADLPPDLADQSVPDEDQQTPDEVDTTPAAVTRTDLISAIEELADSTPGYPTPDAIDDEGDHSVEQILDTFGSWEAALDAADIDLKACLTAELRRLADELGHHPSRREMNKHGQASASLYPHYFGNYDAAIAEVFGPAETAPSVPDRLSDVTTVDAVTENSRLDGPIIVKPTREVSSTGQKKEANFYFKDIDGGTAWCNVWTTHDVGVEWTVGHWYLLENARGRVWTNDDGERNRSLSSTSDLKVTDFGTTKPTGDIIANSGDATPRANSSPTASAPDETTGTGPGTESSQAETNTAQTDSANIDPTNDDTAQSTVDETIETDDGSPGTTDDGEDEILDELLGEFEDL